MLMKGIKPSQSDIELFKKELDKLLGNINQKESEEFHKYLLRDFLKVVYYKDEYFINTKGKNDLVIHTDNTDKSSVGVLIETKSPKNKPEMVSHNNMNVKSFQELLLYYLRERITGKNSDLRHLIITNIYEWVVFDARDFEDTFASDKELIKKFKEFENKTSAATKNDTFYKEIAASAIDKHINNIKFTHFDIRNYDEKSLDLYKFLHPVHLLKLDVANDSNQLNKEFYTELLHIIGLEEETKEGKKLISRKKADNDGSLIETAMHHIKSDEREVLNDPQYGEDKEERTYNAAFRLVIIWINRILFLKLLEAQICKYHKKDKTYAFLSTSKLKNYGDLNELFFSVLAVKTNERQPEHLKAKFAKVPYLNSSLFEQTDIERNSIYIKALGHITHFKTYSKSVLKNESPKSHLEYLLRFLDAYNFSSEDLENTSEENKPLISASVLGLIFEKINGYKDGSFFTPSFITMYMCRETIGRAVVQKFNEVEGWNCQSIDDLHNHIGKNTEDVKEANRIFNTVRICDPAVGSGHFLVSALNEMIWLKYKLEILADKDGKRLKSYNIDVSNDELVITDGEGNDFAYNHKNSESQWLQEVLFNEKRIIIENCLFGVDVNHNSVEICRLRLWIELLKNAYYRDGGKGELETLPNIDINIKHGNSLISRFDLYEKYAELNYNEREKLQSITKEYKNQVFLYKNCSDDRDAKKVIFKRIEEIKRAFNEINDRKDAAFSKWMEAKNKYDVHAFSMRFHSDDDKKEWEKKLDELQKEEERLKKIYQEKMKNAFEWSFEFPEVMGEDGSFVGFDIVIGNPPYIQLQNNGGELAKLYEKCNYETFARTGDIYSLFYERGYQLLKSKGRLCFITSNKWMRAGYGENTRKFLAENTNPEQLIDFAGTKVFDEATVDVNILMFAKGVKNQQKTQACIVGKEGIKELSVFVRQNSTNCSFNINESWVILSPIEQKIKQKIEKIGTPLKEWDIQINYGIKTGFNDAFIISGEKRKELIKQDPKSDEIIRPILRGRDIKRYGYEFADLYLITTFPSLKIDIEAYPAIKQHLLSFGYDRLKQTGEKGARKKTNNKWFETQDSISYWDDFYKQKIVWKIIGSNINFLIEDKGFFYNNAANILTSNTIDLNNLIIFLNSKLFEWYFKKIVFIEVEGGGVQMFNTVMERVPIIKNLSTKTRSLAVDLLDKKEYNKIDALIYSLFELTKEEINFISSSDKSST